jgi:Zn-dependent membrane protease YugP
VAANYLIYFLLISLIPLWASVKVQTTAKKYLKVHNSTNMTGYEVARKILDENGLYDVKVEEVHGFLTDHYDPRTKTVRLSSAVYNGVSLTATAVSAHEVGHALQDQENYAFLRFRTALVPLASLGSQMSYLFLILGLVLGFLNMALLGIILMGFAVLFQVVTLPVEFNASGRALDQVVALGIIRNEEERGARKVLSAAALTYVAAAAVALLELLYFLLQFLQATRNE